MPCPKRRKPLGGDPGEPNVSIWGTRTGVPVISFWEHWGMLPKILLTVGLPRIKIGKLWVTFLIGLSPCGQLTKRITPCPGLRALPEGNIPPPGVPNNQPVKKWFVDRTPRDSRVCPLEEAQDGIGIL